MADPSSMGQTRYTLSSFSLGNLVGVHPKLVKLVRHAILISQQDFRVTDGIRSRPEQGKLVGAGKSWTLRSKHLVQPDGFAHAVDLVPWLDGELSWAWPLCCEVAVAMSEAAHEHRVQLRWGGVWDNSMSAYGLSAQDMHDAVEAYVARRRRAGRRAAIDGPHFELA